MVRSRTARAINPDDVLARHLNTLPKYVVSTTLTDPAWRPATVIAGDLVTEITRLKADSDGAVQETPLRAWHGRCSFAHRSTFRAWLYAIATNTCLDHVRRSRRRA